MHTFRRMRYTRPVRCVSVCDVNNVACVECTFTVGGGNPSVLLIYLHVSKSHCSSHILASVNGS